MPKSSRLAIALAVLAGLATVQAAEARPARTSPATVAAGAGPDASLHQRPSARRHRAAHGDRHGTTHARRAPRATQAQPEG